MTDRGGLMNTASERSGGGKGKGVVMHKRVFLLALVLLATLLPLSCQRIDREPQIPGASAEALPSLTAIPAEYGDLVGVTSNEARPNIAQLWFQKPDKSVVIVYVNFKTGELGKNAFVFPRR